MKTRKKEKIKTHTQGSSTDTVNCMEMQQDMETRSAKRHFIPFCSSCALERLLEAALHS